MSETSFTSEELESLDENRVWPRLAFVPVWLFAYWAIRSGWPASLWGDRHDVPGLYLTAQAFWTLVAAGGMFCWTSLFHETAHQTLWRSKSVSIWLGRFIGAGLLVPYTVYRESHIQHHARLNTPSDWELWPYADPLASLTFRRWFVWVDILFGALTSPFIYCRMFFHPRSPIQGPVRQVVWGEILGTVAVWGTCFTVVIALNDWAGFFFTWCLPHLIAGWFQTLRKLTEHLGMSSYDPLLGTRTVIGQNWLTRLSSYFNFDIFIHGPHHRHPRAAHHELLARMENYIQARPDIQYPIYRSYHEATWAMLPFLFHPGAGMNAGALLPERESSSKPVHDFTSDVSSEVLDPADVVVPTVAWSRDRNVVGQR